MHRQEPYELSVLCLILGVNAHGVATVCSHKHYVFLLDFNPFAVLFLHVFFTRTGLFVVWWIKDDSIPVLIGVVLTDLTTRVVVLQAPWICKPVNNNFISAAKWW